MSLEQVVSTEEQIKALQKELKASREILNGFQNILPVRQWDDDERSAYFKLLLKVTNKAAELKTLQTQQLSEGWEHLAMFRSPQSPRRPKPVSQLKDEFREEDFVVVNK